MKKYPIKLERYVWKLKGRKKKRLIMYKKVVIKIEPPKKLIGSFQLFPVDIDGVRENISFPTRFFQGKKDKVGKVEIVLLKKILPFRGFDVKK